MQQIGHNPLPAARAIAIDPRRLPVPSRRPGNRALDKARRKWVLHRTLLLRLLVGLGVAIVLASAFHARGGILKAVDRFSEAVSGGMATAGFGVAAIDMSGQSITSEKTIADALEIGPKTSLWSYDVQDARARLLALPAVAEVHIRKIYPDRLSVKIVEKKPVARWRVDGVTYLVDKSGAKLGQAAVADDKLPLVIGVGAAENAQVLLNTLGRYPLLEKGLAAVSRIANRRWDLLYNTGLRVQLPEAGLAQALKDLDRYQTKDQLLDRDLVLIDMRVPGSIAVRLASREEDKSQ